MNIRIASNLILSLLATISGQQIAKGDYFDPKFKTSNIAVLCENPFNLKEATTAFSDSAWLQSLNCVRVPEGTAVLRIHPDISSFSEPWQVRLQLPSGKGVTLWGYYFSFTRPNGDKITY
jgi:hypothetical protein